MDFSRHLGHKRAMRVTGLMLSLLLALAACGEAVEDEQFAGDNAVAERVEPAPVRPGAVPVRVGELGANFAACAGAGTTRNLDPAGEGLAVRAAPFETVAETGAIPAGGRFFVCTRSHDQRWLGVVYDDAASLSPACGVSRPSPARRNYEGPCRSGWVSAALVKLIAG